MSRSRRDRSFANQSPPGSQGANSPDSGGLQSALPRQAGQEASSMPAATPGILGGTGLVSLDVQLPARGVEFLFSTPRGKLEVTARAISRPLVERGRQFVLVATLVLVGAWVYRAIGKRRLRV